ncbi:GNAT family N-acetyltransferase [Quadrisphaera setariae]|uniref:GNAT family N-acetyltransferase n=1 Tax=Quadrisphaera setariae TaxID=2593304 RepID=A0A5C8Z424_9ACTN|nr:GNAT family N-acetyltransferase [Quadrisphaera setariae]TXR52842.1 GNAT family N-acetyltransferase [Quadrisphaera setariae]
MAAGPAVPTRRPTTAGRVLVVRPLAPDDVETTAALQASAPPSGALDVPAALGVGFLRRWHLAHLRSPHAVALVAEQVDDDAGRPATGPRATGVLLAVLDRRAHREHLLREHGPGLAAGLAGAPLRTPQALGRWARHHGGPLVQAVTLLPTRGGAAARARRAVSGGAPVPLAVELEQLVVDPAVRGTGVGRQLLASLAAQGAGVGLTRMEVRVPWGTGAEGFFTACGWTASATRPSARGGFETPFHRDL